MDRRETLIEMLTYRRPGRSETEEQFIEKYIDVLGAEKDAYGNRILRIGNSGVLWSCHTDTVHRMEGTQVVNVRGNIASVYEGSKPNSNCLGADCTAGVFIMTEMIKAKKPGLYIFHRDEESGGRGSNWIADNTPEVLEDMQAAIAFDRYGKTSIITHQLARCCSNDFADSMIEQMPDYRKDDGGIFTDTAFYTHLIPECTNISVGYQGHHTSSETQDLSHAELVVDMMLYLDVGKLRISREPRPLIYGQLDDDEIPISHRHAYSTPTYGQHSAWSDESFDDMGGYLTKDDESMVRLIKQNPEAAASLLRLYGITAQELVEHAFSTNSKYVM